MTIPLTPGVYVREAPGGARAIEAAPTAVTVFVGETERGPVGPTSITSATQFRRLFGGYLRDDTGTSGVERLFMPFAVRGFFDNGGPRAYVLRLVSGTPATATRSLTSIQFAEAAVSTGAQTAAIRARQPGAAGENFRVQIADATSAVASEFNLTVEVTADGGATWANRATNPQLEDLNAVPGDPDNVLTRLAGDPDIEWVGDPFRPDNAADQQLQLAGGAPTATLTANAPGIWAEGVRVAVTDAADGDPNRFDLVVFYQAPGEVAHSEVERFSGLSADPTDEKYLVDQLARSAYVAWAGAAMRPVSFGDPDATPPGLTLDGTSGTTGVTASTGTGGDGSVAATGYAAALAALDGLDDAALIVCGSDLMLNAATEAEHNGVINATLGYVEARPQRDLFLVADAPRSVASGDPVGNAVANARNQINASDHLGLYWPRIVVGDPIGLGRSPQLPIPAAGHIAGLFGRTDGRRGVWKVAAGVTATITGANDLDFQIIDRDQDRMNPHGLNAIRTVPGAGRVVWGGRTRRPTTEWRYINVRRTAMYLRRSIYNGIQWAVFEGNDETLWASLRQTIGGFMDAQFRNGAFAGETAREAYFVKCDSDTTTPDDQAAGVVNVQVGFAPLRPAEFVIVTLSQMTATS